MAELDVSRLMSVAEAIGVIDSVPATPRTEEVGIGQAQGCTLAEVVFADRDYPPFDKSLMDGFAVAGAEKEPRIIGEIAAGSISARGIAPGEAMAIMTGAPVPDGTFAVVPIEQTEVAGNQLRLSRPVTAGQNISRRASDVAAGISVLTKGQRLETAQLAVAASVGKTILSVYPPPRTGVISTGDEIVPMDQSPSPIQIRNSNSIMLLSFLRQMGCEPTDLGHVRDDRPLIRDRIEKGMAHHDVLFITGGMSMGKYDFTPQVLQELGVELLITKVRIKPGKPFIFGRKKHLDNASRNISDSKMSRGALPRESRPGDGPALPGAQTPSQQDKFIFGLPGNPVSAMICTLRLAARLMRRLQGQDPGENWIEARLVDGLPANGSREFYQPVRLSKSGATPLPWKGSADIFTLARADALLPRPENDPPIAAGQTVRVMAIGRF